jgi:hypothetical protein
VNLHPGVAAAFTKLEADELGIARLMASGDLTSPQKYINVTLFNIRITGTGISYRPALGEYVWRKPEDYLTDDFVARCNGLAVIMHHPKGALLTSEEYDDRNVGSVMLPYISGDEVWAIVKIYDDEAIELLNSQVMSTSPSVIVGNNSYKKQITLKDGSQVNLLVEDKAKLLDHIAICKIGVWDKDEGPQGIESTTIRGDSIVAEENEDKDMKEWMKRKDEQFDQMLKAVQDACGMVKEVKARSDAFEEKEKEREDKARKDAEEEEMKAKSDAARKDAEDEEMKAKVEKEKEKADAARKDAEEEKEKEKEMAEKAKADASAMSGMEAKIKELEALIKLGAPDIDRKALAAAQSRADDIHNQLGSGQARAPMLGESAMAYRRRLAEDLQKHSAKFKEFNLARLDDANFSVIEDTIYADAAIAAQNPTEMSPGTLREIKKRSPAGHQISEFVGGPDTSFVHMFRRPIAYSKLNDIDDGRRRR